MTSSAQGSGPQSRLPVPLPLQANLNDSPHLKRSASVTSPRSTMAHLQHTRKRSPLQFEGHHHGGKEEKIRPQRSQAALILQPSRSRLQESDASSPSSTSATSQKRSPSAMPVSSVRGSIHAPSDYYDSPSSEPLSPSRLKPPTERSAPARFLLRAFNRPSSSGGDKASSGNGNGNANGNAKREPSRRYIGTISEPQDVVHLGGAHNVPSIADALNMPKLSSRHCSIPRPVTAPSNTYPASSAEGFPSSFISAGRQEGPRVAGKNRSTQSPRTSPTPPPLPYQSASTYSSRIPSHSDVHSSTSSAAGPQQLPRRSQRPGTANDALSSDRHFGGNVSPLDIVHSCRPSFQASQGFPSAQSPTRTSRSRSSSVQSSSALPSFSLQQFWRPIAQESDTSSDQVKFASPRALRQECTAVNSPYMSESQASSSDRVPSSPRHAMEMDGPYPSLAALVSPFSAPPEATVPRREEDQESEQTPKKPGSLTSSSMQDDSTRRESLFSDTGTAASISCSSLSSSVYKDLPAANISALSLPLELADIIQYADEKQSPQREKTVFELCKGGSRAGSDDENEPSSPSNGTTVAEATPPLWNSIQTSARVPIHKKYAFTMVTGASQDAKTVDDTLEIESIGTCDESHGELPLADSIQEEEADITVTRGPVGCFGHLNFELQLGDIEDIFNEATHESGKVRLAVDYTIKVTSSICNQGVHFVRGTTSLAARKTTPTRQRRPRPLPLNFALAADPSLLLQSSVSSPSGCCTSRSPPVHTKGSSGFTVNSSARESSYDATSSDVHSDDIGKADSNRALETPATPVTPMTPPVVSTSPFLPKPLFLPTRPLHNLHQGHQQPKWVTKLDVATDSVFGASHRDFPTTTRKGQACNSRRRSVSVSAFLPTSAAGGVQRGGQTGPPQLCSSPTPTKASS